MDFLAPKMDTLSPSCPSPVSPLRDLSTQHFYAVLWQLPHAAAVAVATAIGRVNLIKETSRISGYDGKRSHLHFFVAVCLPFLPLQFTPQREGQIYEGMGILSFER